MLVWTFLIGFALPTGTVASVAVAAPTGSSQAIHLASRIRFDARGGDDSSKDQTWVAVTAGTGLIALRQDSVTAVRNMIRHLQGPCAFGGLTVAKEQDCARPKPPELQPSFRVPPASNILFCLWLN